MGRPPAYIFVVRHGNRLDAADRNWHISSPAPYDPPLTYGGWLQSRALGVKIGTILRQREDEDEENEAEEEEERAQAWSKPGNTAATGSQQPAASAKPRRRRKKRYEVVIHSSPFLRCIQTSIAISAGMAQNPLLPVDGGLSARRLSRSSMADSPPAPALRVAATRINQFPDAPRMPVPRSIPGSAMTPTLGASVVVDAMSPGKTAAGGGDSTTIRKAVLRLDCFLGEWLSPEYYETIAPPPSSSLMLVTAKAELLKREDYNAYPHFNYRAHSNSAGAALPSSTHLWGLRPPTNTTPTMSRPHDFEVGSLESLSKLGPALLERQGSSVTSDANSAGSKGTDGVATASARRVSFSIPEQTYYSSTGSVAGSIISTAARGYVPPTPAYALSHSGQIPMGYVSHAKDACVWLDYQWDSMREPYNWGDGGAFPEEWTDMHRRFRKGLQRMVDWYSTAENATEPVTKMVGQKADKAKAKRAVQPTQPKPKPAPTTNTSATDADECAVVEDDETAVSSESGAAAAAEQDGSDSDLDDDDDDDVEVEPVIIIVSHGAGCNALIGAITHQPALMDVGIASLTMALRRPEYDRDFQPSDPSTGSSSARGSNATAAAGGLVSIHQYYDLKISANTEHLRSSSLNSPGVGANRSPSVSSVGHGATSNSNSGGSVNFPGGGISSSARGRFTGGSFIPTAALAGAAGGGLDGANGVGRSASANAALGSMRRPHHNNPSNSLPRGRDGGNSPAVGSPMGPGAVNYSHQSSGSYGTGLSTYTYASAVPTSGLAREPSTGLWSPLARKMSEDEWSSAGSEAGGRRGSQVQQQQSDTSSDKGKDAADAPLNSPTSKLVIGSADTPQQQQHDSPDLPVFSPLGLGAGTGGLWGGAPAASTAPSATTAVASSSSMSGSPPTRGSSISGADGAGPTKRRWTVNSRPG